MNQLGFPLLSATVFLPLAGALAVLLMRSNRRMAQLCALAVTLADLLLAITLWGTFDYGQPGMQMVDRAAWIESWGISYHLGVDGVNLWFLLLAAFLGPVAVLLSSSFLEGRPEAAPHAYFFWLLSLQTGVLGVFAAGDLILFYVFWEAVLVPLYFLIGRWGSERRTHAMWVFFLYTMAGSALMLVAILALAVFNYQETGLLTFDLASLHGPPLPWLTQVWLFLAFALAFAVKAPIWPLHTWLPDAYVEAPAPVTVILAAVLSKMGIYGLIRFCLAPFPSALAVFQPWIWLLAIVGILYGSLLALVQRDMKRLVAYSSLAHVGLLAAGVIASNAQGVQGALVGSVSHGLTVAALFIVVDLLERRCGTRLLDALGGLWRSIPLLGTLLLTSILAAVGLPGLSGFPGEFAILVGIFRESPAAASCAALGIVLGAWYLLNLYRQAFAGPLRRPEHRVLPDVRRREALLLLPLVILMFIVGILPNLVLQPTTAAVQNLLDQAEDRQAAFLELPEADLVSSLSPQPSHLRSPASSAQPVPSEVEGERSPAWQDGFPLQGSPRR